MNVVSLFAGIGGICQGFKNVGFNIIWANECDSNAIKTYKENFNHELNTQKIEDVDISSIPECNVVVGGFPCTSFSVAGHQKGFSDENAGHLFFNMLEVIQAKQPYIIFIENVKNLVTHDKGKTFKIIKDALEQEGYHLKYQVMNTCEYGNLPQNRERIYIVGFKSKEHYNNFVFPDKIPLTISVKDITNPYIEADRKYYYDQYSCGEQVYEEATNPDTVYQWRRAYVRENKSNLCPTLVAAAGKGGHNVPLIRDDFGVRKLTPRECFLLQGFSEDYNFPLKMANCHLYTQIGNSVSIPVIERIAKNIAIAMC